jgi:hypothetical protein
MTRTIKLTIIFDLIDEDNAPDGDYIAADIRSSLNNDGTVDEVVVKVEEEFDE